MRWLFIIIVFITSCLADQSHHDKPSKIAPITEFVDHQLLPLSKSFFCHPPQAQEKPQWMKVMKTAVNPSYKEKVKDPVIVLGTALFIIIGSIMLFPAFYLFRIAAGFTGLITSIYLTCLLYGFFHPSTIHFTVSLIWFGVPVGIIATVVFGYFYTFALYVLSFISGWFLVVFCSTLALNTEDVFKHLLLRDCFSLAVGLIFVIGTRTNENMIVGLSVPFIGSYFIGIGIDLVFQTGLVYMFGTSICLYEPLPKYTFKSSIAIALVACFWLLGAGAYIVGLRGKRWGLNIKRIHTEEEQHGASTKH